MPVVDHTDHLQEARDLVLRAESGFMSGERPAEDLAEQDLRTAAAHALIDMAASLRRIVDAFPRPAGGPPDEPTPAVVDRGEASSRMPF